MFGYLGLWQLEIKRQLEKKKFMFQLDEFTEYRVMIMIDHGNQSQHKLLTLSEGTAF